MTVPELIEKHFPCVGCDRYVTLKHWSDHFPTCPVRARSRATSLVKEIMRRRLWTKKRKPG